MSDMKWKPNKCPECGEAADRRDEEVPGACQLQYDPDTDAYEFGGETEILWDGQMPTYNADGTETLRCENDHEWGATPIDENGKPQTLRPDPVAIIIREVKALIKKADQAANQKGDARAPILNHRSLDRLREAVMNHEGVP